MGLILLYKALVSRNAANSRLLSADYKQHIHKMEGKEDADLCMLFQVAHQHDTSKFLPRATMVS